MAFWAVDLLSSNWLFEFANLGNGPLVFPEIDLYALHQLGITQTYVKTKSKDVRLHNTQKM